MLRFGLVALAGCGRIAFAAVDDAGGDGTTDIKLTTYRDIVMADSPLAYWRFDDTGSTAHDEVGAFDGAYAGTCDHTVTGALAGDGSKALGLDASTCVIDIGDVLAFPGLSPFTIELWVDENVTNTVQIFWMKETRNGSNPMDGYALLNSPLGVYLERIVNPIGGHNTVRVQIASGAWVYIVATFDGGNEHLYVDGVEAGSPSTDTLSMNTYSAACSLGGFLGPFNVVDGDLDEVAIYGHALAAESIARHYDYGHNGPR